MDKGKYYNTSKKYLILLVVAILFMSVGYASINSVTMSMDGDVVAVSQEGIFITDVIYNDGLEQQSYKVNNIYQSIMHSNIVLSSENPNSYIEYKVTIHNSYADAYYFQYVDYIDEDTLLGNSTYSNSDIIFELIGLEQYDEIAPGGNIEFYIRFYYKDNVVADNNSLESYLNFVFMKRYSATNMITNGSFEDTLDLDYIVQDSSIYTHGSKSGKLVSNSNTFDYLGYHSFYKEHVYYFTGDFNIVELTGNNYPYVFFEVYVWLDDNWGQSQWYLDKFNRYEVTNGWEKWSFRVVESTDGTNIPVRLGVFDAQHVWLDVEAYFDSFVLIDLTETFGAGNEPDKKWCDEHITYFDDIVYLYK